MRVTITTAGSRGDVQPYVALGAGLNGAGHEVTLAAPAAFEEIARGWGVGVSRDRARPLAGRSARARGGDANLLEFAWHARDILGAAAKENLRAYLGACRGAEAVIYSPVGFLGFRVAGDLGIPRVGTTYGPLLNPTRLFPCSFMPVPSGRLRVLGRDAFGSLKGLYNRLSYPLAQQTLWQPMRAPITSALRDEPRLSPFPSRDHSGSSHARANPSSTAGAGTSCPTRPIGARGSRPPATGSWIASPTGVPRQTSWTSSSPARRR